jgi:hypothetical protein
MSFCLGCGTSMSAEERFCGNCGRDASSGASLTPALDPQVAFGLSPETSRKAIFSLVSGVLGLFPPFAVVAVVFGHLSLSEIRKSGGRLVGRGIAIAGLVLGYGGFCLIAFLIILGFASMPHGKPLSKGQLTTVVSSTQPVAVAAIRSLNTAEIAYAQAHRGAGYTCSLEELSSSWGISGDVARAQQNGYVIALQGCAAAKTDGPVTKYQIAAYPAQPAPAKLPAFCSNQSDVIKVDWNGSSQGCLTKGIDLSDTETNR